MQNTYLATYKTMQRTQWITLLWDLVSCLNGLQTHYPKRTLQSPLLSQTKPLQHKYWKIIVVSTNSPKSPMVQYNMVKTTKSHETYLRWRKRKCEQEPSMEKNRAWRTTFDGEQQLWLGCRDKHFKIARLGCGVTYLRWRRIVAKNKKLWWRRIQREQNRACNLIF